MLLIGVTRRTVTMTNSSQPGMLTQCHDRLQPITYLRIIYAHAQTTLHTTHKPHLLIHNEML